MPKLKFEQKENMFRTEAAARLSAITDALGSDAEFDSSEAARSWNSMCRTSPV